MSVDERVRTKKKLSEKIFIHFSWTHKPPPLHSSLSSSSLSSLGFLLPLSIKKKHTVKDCARVVGEKFETLSWTRFLEDLPTLHSFYHPPKSFLHVWVRCLSKTTQIHNEKTESVGGRALPWMKMRILVLQKITLRQPLLWLLSYFFIHPLSRPCLCFFFHEWKFFFLELRELVTKNIFLSLKW